MNSVLTMSAGEACSSPQLWLLFFNIAGVGTIGVATWNIVHSCFHPPQTNLGDCSGVLSKVHEKWSAILYVFATMAASSVTMLVLRGYQTQCGGQMCSDILSVLASMIIAAASTAYATTFVDTLNDTATRENAAFPPCIVCPMAHNGMYHFVLWCGVITMWFGVGVGIIASVFRPSSEKKYKEISRQLARHSDKLPENAGGVELGVLADESLA